MLSKSDKEWVKDEMTVSTVRLGLEFDKKIDGLKEEIRSKHDDVMTKLDKIMSEVVKGREHDLVVDHQIEKLNKAVFG